MARCAFLCGPGAIIIFLKKFTFVCLLMPLKKKFEYIINRRICRLVNYFFIFGFVQIRQNLKLPAKLTDGRFYYITHDISQRMCHWGSLHLTCPHHVNGNIYVWSLRSLYLCVDGGDRLHVSWRGWSSSRQLTGVIVFTSVAKKYYLRSFKNESKANNWTGASCV